MHPDNEARFWGMTANQDKGVDKLRTGDVVLFTGANHVQGIGEVGLVLRNAAVGDLLWKPHPDRGSYHNVYSLKSFTFTQIPYAEIWALPSFNTGDNFMGARFLTGTKADEILTGLDITTRTAAERERSAQQAEVERAAKVLGFVADEALHVESTEYVHPGGRMTVNRFEALLVRRYREHLGVETRRIRCDAGVTDMAIGTDDDLEIVEAKSNTSRLSVRTAIGQLLDYGYHIPGVRTFTILLPAQPEPSLESLCLRLGITLVYLDSEGHFTRCEAARGARVAMAALLAPLLEQATV